MQLLYVLADTAEKYLAPEKPVGGVSTQSIILDSVVFLLGILVLGGLLVWIGKRIFVDERY